MVYVTGDCHAEFTRFSTSCFPEQKEMSREDTMIICGDFGIWNNNGEERYWLKWLNNKPFTTVFVDGNHENFDRLYSNEFQVVDFHGGPAHMIKPHIFHLMRGNVFEFDGKKFWCFGGASSHDISDGVLDMSDFQSKEEFIETIKIWRLMQKDFRINHVSWWKEELPSSDEMEHGLSVLAENDYSVDYVITHCCPQFLVRMMGFEGSDVLTRYLNAVSESLDFDKWYFGHYHIENAYLGKYIAHYKSIERII